MENREFDNSEMFNSPFLNIAILIVFSALVIYPIYRIGQLNHRSNKEYESIPIRKESVKITEMHRDDTFFKDRYRIEISRLSGPITDLYISHADAAKHPINSNICVQYRIFQGQETGIELCNR